MHTTLHGPRCHRKTLSFLSQISKIFMLVLFAPSITLVAQSEDIRLMVRIDDMGFSHAANLACIDAYTKGIARSVEVMATGPWFEEAAQLLNEHPGLDVGVHLAITSEWQNLKWRPLTHCPSLTDEDGYFYPTIWNSRSETPVNALARTEWKIQEIEQELRAQIELTLKKIPHTSHLTGHMGCTRISVETEELFKKLAKEYGLDIHPAEMGVQRAPRWTGKEFNAADKIDRLLDMLDQLTPGDWMTVSHPGYDVEELRTVGHPGYENVAFDRDAETRALISLKVKEKVKERGIKLISYRDLK